MKELHYDVTVLGAGSGGLNVASGTARMDLKTLLIEKTKIGGDCLNFGCVPSKALIKTAKVMHTLRHAAKYGVRKVDYEFDLKDAMDRIRSIQAGFEKHENPEALKKDKDIDVMMGSPEFDSPKSLLINDTRIFSKRFVIATGSRPFVPPITGLKDAGYITNEQVFSLEKLPPRLAVIGGGPIGSEMAQAFARMGSKVTLIEMGEHILFREDKELAEILQEEFKKDGVRVLTSAETKAVRIQQGVKVLDIHGKNGLNETIEADEVLVSTGRQPNLEGLGLEAAGIEYGPRAIAVDKYLRTTNKNIFALGDVIGGFLFTHTAEYEAGIIFSKMVLKLPRKATYDVVPWTTFTDPELARAGITEAEAVEQNIPHSVVSHPFSGVDRPLAESESVGLCKLVISPKGRLLGFHMLGPHAGDLCQELVLAMRKKMKLSEISMTIHTYPTSARIGPKAIGQFYAPKLFSPFMKKAVRFLWSFS